LAAVAEQLRVGPDLEVGWLAEQDDCCLKTVDRLAIDVRRLELHVAVVVLASCGNARSDNGRTYLDHEVGGVVGTEDGRDGDHIDRRYRVGELCEEDVADADVVGLNADHVQSDHLREACLPANRVSDIVTNANGCGTARITTERRCSIRYPMG
jgi:hypothetical protein